MIKVVWFSSCVFSDTSHRFTGSWLQPLAEGLIRSGEVEVFNITRDFTSSVEVTQTACNIKQWILPKYRPGEGRLSSEPYHVCCRVQAILDEIQPDIVHIWGTEFKWASIFKKGYINYPCFLDMQGVMSSCAPIYLADLQGKERQNVLFGWQDLQNIKKSILWRFSEMKKKAKRERQLLPLFSHISVQSKFAAQWVGDIAPSAKLLHTGIILRKEFYSAPSLSSSQAQPFRIFTSASSFDLPYKGLHVLLKALVILKLTIPNIELWMCGKPLRTGKQSSGYERKIADLIEREQLGTNIKALGSLDASQLIEAMGQCTICIVPSFVESYCLGMAEAMMAGMACVASRAGAMPELAIASEEALFFTPGSATELAEQALRLLQDPVLRADMGQKARARRLRDNQINQIVAQQIENYRIVLHDSQHN